MEHLPAAKPPLLFRYNIHHNSRVLSDDVCFTLAAKIRLSETGFSERKHMVWLGLGQRPSLA
jgi:hypothetical protein